MQVKFTNRGTTLIVSIEGELDHHSAEYLRQKVDGEIIKSNNKNIIFDFSGLGFMDSSGIGVVMGRYKNLQKLGGKAAVASANPQIRRVLEMSGLLKFVPIYGRLEEAVSSF